MEDLVVRSLKGRNCRQFPTLMAFLFLTQTLQGCSWLSNRRQLFGEDKRQQSVPREQYDNLLSKYETLVRETRGEPEIPKEKSNVPTTPAVERQNLMDDLSKQNSAELAETVDVFRESSKSAPVPSPQYEAGRVMEEIKTLRKGMDLVNQNKFSEALTLLKGLEKSEVRQVAVQAKFYIGEILFRQSEFDLSMQLFEEIIRKDAFSGVVLKALGKLIVCTEKLKLSKKRERYYSMLHDFFEAG